MFRFSRESRFQLSPALPSGEEDPHAKIDLSYRTRESSNNSRTCRSLGTLRRRRVVVLETAAKSVEFLVSAW